MYKYERVFLEEDDQKTLLNYRWDVILPDGQRFPWTGFYTGPLKLTDQEISSLCRELLGIEIQNLTKTVSKELQPVTGQGEVGPQLIIHSTTPDLNTFEGDLDQIIRGGLPKDCTAYKETRSVYLGKSGDLAVGRISSWKAAAVQDGIDVVEVPGIEYYYLSHALLVLAKRHLTEPQSSIVDLIEFLRCNLSTTVRLYALEKEMQIFLVWLKRQASLTKLYMDANDPKVAETWNCKSVLHPTIQDALALDNKVHSLSPYQLLDLEASLAPINKKLGLTMPVLPGYTITRTGVECSAFIEQTIQAARLLKIRYGLLRGCFKAAESGDGARIFANLDLRDEFELEHLAKSSYINGDDYILEAHTDYLTVSVGEHTLQLCPSAHIRQGDLAEGLTLQIQEGSSWKGNVYLDKNTSESIGISSSHYQIITDAMTTFLQAFKDRRLGMTIAGLDFAIGKVGGVFKDDVLIAIQDPNISFNGAECLRVFLEKTKVHFSPDFSEPVYAATKVIHPSPHCTLKALRQLMVKKRDSGMVCEAIASLPDRWGMIGAVAEEPTAAFVNVMALENFLQAEGLAL